jgi:hypothetical protein
VFENRVKLGLGCVAAAPPKSDILNGEKTDKISGRGSRRKRNDVERKIEIVP